MGFYYKEFWLFRNCHISIVAKNKGCEMAAKNVSLPLKIALIGQGLSAEVFLYYFLKDLQATSLEITQFYAEDFAPACSLKSTAMAHTQGIQYGISPLGDLLLKAFEETVTFCDLEKPLGVERIPYYFSAHPTQNSNLIKRFSHLQKKRTLKLLPSIYKHFYRRRFAIFSSYFFILVKR